MQLDTILSALPNERRDAVATFLADEVAKCPDCERPVTRIQPREPRKDAGICHLNCDAHR